MERFIREKGVTVPFHRIGNYRYAYYQKHRTFYDHLLPPKTRKTFLYAPTWQDAEALSSFPYVWEELLNPPEGIELLVKLHPNLYEQFPDEIVELRKHLKLIENFPPIYPLLARTDLLIGDHSSINDDFLIFNSPTFQWKPDSPSLFGEGSISNRDIDDIFAPYSPLSSVIMKSS
jgi:CDP-glycerol glycerophosphotransferase (TagB/SpsB family)